MTSCLDVRAQRDAMSPLSDEELVLSLLVYGGPCSLKEIAEYTNMKRIPVYVALHALIKKRKIDYYEGKYRAI